MEKSKKIAVIDDSAFMRRVLSDILNNDETFTVVGTANNGVEGLKLIENKRPDAVILDINMPVMDGLEMLSQLQKKPYIPVLVVSTITTKDAIETIRALEGGAFDFIAKPDNLFSMKNNDFIDIFKEKLTLAIESKKVESNIGKSFSMNYVKNKGNTNKKNNKIVALGCSTGGPKALHNIIPLLPKTLNSSVVIVQHMPKGFTKSLADRLNELSQINVKEAEDGEILQTGTVYIARGGNHMLIKKEQNHHIIKLSDSEPRQGHRPSVNNMMESLIDCDFDEIIGIILTGMGSDGTEGLKLLSETKKVYNIVQNQETCVVYGMPKSVVENGLADEIVPLENIPEIIINKVGVL
ncbi:two-component system chemotaxis response regulator CheB [Natranaerovirga pectinivora]|uniref:Protein-glutamate methylesterase/protein-glutamine glutaminase n=1 Tax=Natranaerovirga pectinivora TaxID=682400 RepID=A0A4V2V0B6_9FIRM|nr:chemotaxis response regulator protein-glutamate methylesterase [Natranaerovirga pectinivora]TCT15081.1 two-component system chemotaxis response regulator CheB [Natranaerovirga pectinivora]